MKKRTIAIVLLILMLLVGGNFYRTSKVETKKQNVKDGASISEYATGSIDMLLNILKKDEEGQFLDNVRFHMSSYNDTFTGSSYFNESYYKIDEYENGERYFEDAYNTLSFEQQQLISSIHTKNDLQSLSSDYIVSCLDNHDNLNPVAETLPADGLEAKPEVYLSSCYIILPTAFVLEETKAPEGYLKEKYYIPGYIQVGFNLEGYTPRVEPASDENSLTFSEQQASSSNLVIGSISIHSGNPQYLIRYGDVDFNQLVGTNIEQVARIWRNKAIDLECGVEEIQVKEATPRNSEIIKPVGVPKGTEEIFTPYGSEGTCLINHKGNVALEAKSFVNNSDSATIQVNQTLEYKVVVTNTGTGDAIDNVVRLTVPEGFVYIEGSATDGGFYHNGVVEWNVERIDVGKTRELSFKAYAPNGVPVGHEYVGNATIENSNLDTPVTSNQTMVRLSFQNPYTAAPIGILVVIGIFIFSVVLCAIQRKQESK